MDKTSKAQLIATVAESQGITKVAATNIIDATLSAVSTEVSQGRAVSLGKQFGIFRPFTTKAVTKIHPVTKEPVASPSRQVIKFSASAALKRTINV